MISEYGTCLAVLLRDWERENSMICGGVVEGLAGIRDDGRCFKE